MRALVAGVAEEAGRESTARSAVGSGVGARGVGVGVIARTRPRLIAECPQNFGKKRPDGQIPLEVDYAEMLVDLRTSLEETPADVSNRGS
jgi:hypothetical protein